MKIQTVLAKGLSVGALILSGSGFAVANLTNALPVGLIFPTPVGICFAGMPIAAGVNASALATNKKGNSFQLAASPALQTGDALTGFGSFASNTGPIGYGIGYTGSMATGGLVNGLFSGVGFKVVEPFSLGIGARAVTLAGGFNPSIDMSATYHSSGGASASLVAYGLESAPQIAVGFGYAAAKKHSVEFNVMTPPLGSSSSDYVGTVSAAVYSGSFGASFRTSYYLSSRTFTETLGVLVWVFDKLNVSLQLTSPRTLTAGLTYAF